MNELLPGLRHWCTHNPDIATTSIATGPRPMGDDPEGIKRRTKARFLEVCDDVDFDHLLFAHGAPLIGDGREALRAICTS